MTITDILEHWATIYRPLSHHSDGKLEEQSFFRIRYIDLENTFTRNANVLHSPCMLQSVTSTGELKSAGKVEVTHQVWFLSKLKDTTQSLGRFDGIRLEQAANDLVEHCESLITWLLEVRRTGICPVTHQTFKEDPQLASELQAIDIESLSYGVMSDIYSGQWLIAGVDWKSVRPLLKFGCSGVEQRYHVPQDDNQ